VDPRDRQVDGCVVEIDLQETQANNAITKPFPAAQEVTREEAAAIARTCTATFFSWSQSIFPACCGAVLAAASASSPPTLEMAVAASTYRRRESECIIGMRVRTNGEQADLVELEADVLHLNSHKDKAEGRDCINNSGFECAASP
jgi:hypothetical protein